MLQGFIDEQEVAMSRSSVAAAVAKDVEKPQRKSRFEKYMDDSNSQDMTELNRYMLHNFTGANDGKNYRIFTFLYTVKQQNSIFDSDS